ncbi:MAG: carbohydrate ABC transporter permease [Candidatus Aphodomonas sp.]|nr:carbohydrate ABC transporter permease [Candidatus Aphodomonas sp.]
MPAFTHRANAIRQDRISRIYTAIVYALIAILTLVITYPLYFCVIASFSNPDAVVQGDTIFWFKGFSTTAYSSILKEKLLLSGFKNAMIYMVFGTIYNMALTIPAAYVLSKKDLPGGKGLLWFFFLTMYISGGLIPTYMWYKDLGLVDNPLVMIIGTGVSAYNMIVARQFFSTSIPDTLYEAAEIDGASELCKFWRIALPLSKPILAVITLYYAFSKWNSYYTSLIYLRKQSYWPLQLVLRQLLISSEQMVSEMATVNSADPDYLIKRIYLVRSMKYAIILVSSLPMLILYPFVQKYFTKGVMVGAIKG